MCRSKTALVYFAQPAGPGCGRWWWHKPPVTTASSWAFYNRQWPPSEPPCREWPSTHEWIWSVVNTLAGVTAIRRRNVVLRLATASIGYQRAGPRRSGAGRIERRRRRAPLENGGGGDLGVLVPLCRLLYGGDAGGGACRRLRMRRDRSAAIASHLNRRMARLALHLPRGCWDVPGPRRASGGGDVAARARSSGGGWSKAQIGRPAACLGDARGARYYAEGAPTARRAPRRAHADPLGARARLLRSDGLPKVARRAILWRREGALHRRAYA